MNQSQELQDLYLALSIAQGEIENATKVSENPGFKRGNRGSKYADLASVRDAYRLPFSKNGLVLLQMPTTEGTKVTVLTRLAHKSGQFIEEPLSMNALNLSPQAIGSTLTYIRRYAAMCFTGIAPEDDDGNAASRTTENLGVDGQTAREESRSEIAEDDDRDDTAEFERRRQAKDHYIEEARKAWNACKTQEDLTTWWKLPPDRMTIFDSKEDPAYVMFLADYKDKGKSLPAAPTKPAPNELDAAVPPTPPNGMARPSNATIRITLLEKLAEAKTEDDCHAAYTEIVEPYESSLKQDETVELVRLVKSRLSQVKP
jgi:hypothetical protein